ncbi:MAG: hypothetical protein AABY32_04295 [Nanoarchaeota archaeon]
MKYKNYEATIYVTNLEKDFCKKLDGDYEPIDTALSKFGYFDINEIDSELDISSRDYIKGFYQQEDLAKQISEAIKNIAGPCKITIYIKEESKFIFSKNE